MTLQVSVDFHKLSALASEGLFVKKSFQKKRLLPVLSRMSSAHPSVPNALLHLRHLQPPAPYLLTSTPEPPQTEPFPITLLIAAALTASVIGTGLIVYFKKHQLRLV